MNHTPDTLADALRAAGHDLFQDRRSDAPARAADCLAGRTHYYSADTRRFFGARVLSCRVLESGLLLGTVESQKRGFEEYRRIYRPVFFDIFGTVVYRPDGENSFKSRPAAEREFWAWLETFDPVQYYRGVLESRAQRAEQSARDLRAIIGS